MVKLIHILYSGLGGHGHDVFSIIESDSDKKYNHKIIFYGIEKPIPQYLKNCKKYGVEFTFVNRKSLSFLATLKHINLALVHFKPKVILIHSNAAIPAVLMYRLFHFTNLVFRETQATNLKTKKEWLYSGLAQLFADRVIFLSIQYEKNMKKKLAFLLNKSKTRIIPNGLDLGLFPKRIKRKVTDIVKIGMQSRLVEIKDYKTLITSIELLKHKSYFSKIFLEIAGDGDQRKELENLVHHLGLQDKIVFLGMLDKVELKKFMLDLDIYVHATFGETMSTAIMQAQAYALPIIASDASGVNNVIRHEHNGLLVPTSNKFELAKALDLLICDLKKRIIYGEKSKKYAIKNLSNKTMFNRYVKVFDDLLE